MAKKRKHLIDGILLCLMLVAIFLLMSHMMKRFHLNETVSYEADRSIVDNPLMGYAPMAQDRNKCKDTNLVFVELKWADWEPIEDHYNYAFLNREFHWDEYKEQGKHAVLRFICDLPESQPHMDIPLWLYNLTMDGEEYDTSMGMGYCPNYENEIFIEKHQKAIEALAKYCNQDSFVAYVELGSLGHWGEWHAKGNDAQSKMPDAETCWSYVLPYTDNFHNAKMLMRRSYSYAVEGKLGVYNDVVGNKKETEEWLEWMQSGSTQSTIGTPLTIEPYEQFWTTAPVGGEITSSIDEKTLYGDELASLLHQIEISHMTFLGPKVGNQEDYLAPYESIQRRLGYKIYVKELSTTFDFSENALKLTLLWENDGIAPFYWDWPVNVKVYDSTDELVYWQTLDLKLSELVPGVTLETITMIPYTDAIRDAMSIGIEITSFDGKDHMQLAMSSDKPYEIRDGAQIIYEYGQ